MKMKIKVKSKQKLVIFLSTCLFLFYEYFPVVKVIPKIKTNVTDNYQYLLNNLTTFTLVNVNNQLDRLYNQNLTFHGSKAILTETISIVDKYF